MTMRNPEPRRRIRQIAYDEGPDGFTLLALCDDDSIWWADGTAGDGWRRWPAVPGAGDDPAALDDA